MEMLDRDYAAALAAVDASDTEVFSGQYGMNPRGVLRGIALRAMGDEAGAMAAFQEAREAMEGMIPELEDDCRVHGALGRIYASMGMREEAIRAAMHAVELLPPEKDALIGPFNMIVLAEVYATLGEPEAAVERLEYLLSIPSGITRWGLRSGPQWDPIREHPSFQALLEG
jgi:tetratricopeptide (TPR) repeat protein